MPNVPPIIHVMVRFQVVFEYDMGLQVYSGDGLIMSNVLIIHNC